MGENYLKESRKLIYGVIMINFVIVVPTGPQEAKYYTHIAEYIGKSGYNTAFLTESEKVKSVVEGTGYKCWNIHEVINEYDIRSKNDLKEYGIDDLEAYILPEKMYWEGNTEKLVRKALLFFPAIEKLLEENDIECFVHNVGGEILRRVVNDVAKKSGMHNFFVASATVPGLRSVLFTDIMFKWDDMKLQKYDSLSKTEKEYTEKILSQFKEKKEVYFMKHEKKNLIKSIHKPIKHIKTEIEKITSDDPSLSDEGITTYKRKIIKLVRGFLFKNFLFTDPDDREKFIFFPLHVTNDSQITMRAPQFLSQENLIEEISKNMPEDYMLYVKPHPGCYLYSFKKLRNIIKNGNVRVIRSNVNAHDLIRKSKSVITINSSVGFEALFYFKPVIALGKPFYGGSGITIDVKSTSDLKSSIEKSLSYEPDKNKIKAFIHAAYKATWPGRMYIDTEENYSKVTISFIDKLKKLKR